MTQTQTLTRGQWPTGATSSTSSTTLNTCSCSGALQTSKPCPHSKPGGKA